MFFPSKNQSLRRWPKKNPHQSSSDSEKRWLSCSEFKQVQTGFSFKVFPMLVHDLIFFHVLFYGPQVGVCLYFSMLTQVGWRFPTGHRSVGLGPPGMPMCPKLLSFWRSWWRSAQKLAFWKFRTTGKFPYEKIVLFESRVIGTWLENDEHDPIVIRTDILELESQVGFRRVDCLHHLILANLKIGNYAKAKVGAGGFNFFFKQQHSCSQNGLQMDTRWRERWKEFLWRHP